MADLVPLSKHVTAAHVEGDTAIFTLKGEIDLHSSPDLRTDLLGVLQGGAVHNLVLHMADVPYVDSSAIAVMVEALQRLRKAGGKVSLVDLSPRVKGLLSIARLDSIFTVVSGTSAGDTGAGGSGSDGGAA